jgi:hypothetical protein
MDTRQLSAYALIALMLLAGAAWAAWARHNTRDRKIDRRRAREQASRDRRREEA